MPRSHGTRALIFGLGALCVYLAMIQGTLAHLEAVAGLRPFDMRPAGYGASEARALLDALGEEGRRYYLSRQIPLDTLYPALFAATAVAILGWAEAPAPRSAWARVAGPAALVAAAADYAENAGIVAMIRAAPNMADLLPSATSAASVVKAIATIAAVLMVAASVATSLLGRWRDRRGRLLALANHP